MQVCVAAGWGRDLRSDLTPNLYEFTESEVTVYSASTVILDFFFFFPSFFLFFFCTFHFLLVKTLPTRVLLTLFFLFQSKTPKICVTCTRELSCNYFVVT